MFHGKEEGVWSALMFSGAKYDPWNQAYDTVSSMISLKLLDPKLLLLLLIRVFHVFNNYVRHECINYTRLPLEQ